MKRLNIFFVAKIERINQYFVSFLNRAVTSAILVPMY